ncbi:MAG: DICT sensory domain-containing protein [Cyanophyceae cyanobacterium]
MLEGSILQKLDEAHKDSNRPLNLGVYYKNTLVALCHALEDFILQAESAPVMVTAFQRGKWYLQEAERYGDLADKADHVVIMASPDTGFQAHPTSNRANVDLVSLRPEDPVAQEWHLMILSSTYSAMVLCQELSAADYGSSGQPENDIERKFYGFWTFEPDLVKETVELAIAHIREYDLELANQLTTKLEMIATEMQGHQQESLGSVVSQVVEYLQSSQEQLSQLQEPESVSYLPNSSALDDNLLSNETQAFLRMAQLIDRADVKNPRAAAEVAALTEMMAQLLDLPAWQQKRLRLASLLHRLVPSLGGTVASKNDDAAPHCQLVPGVQALRVMPRMRAIAEIITHQTERWDGTGFPGGIGYDAIPLESRILGIAVFFQEQVNRIRTHGQDNGISREEALSQALANCQEQASLAFDPKLVEAMGVLVMGMQQGMNLEVQQPKITAGMWLVEAAPVPGANATV